MVTRQFSLPQDDLRFVLGGAPAFNLAQDKTIYAEAEAALSLEQQLRQQLAQDLNDGPMQALSNMTMQLMVMKEQIAAEPDSMNQELSELVLRMQEVVREMRARLYELRPLALERQGLVPVLYEFAAHLHKRYTPEIHLDVPATNLDLALATQTNVFYFVQEAAQNALKHANVKHLRIALSIVGDLLNVIVCDDGEEFEMGTAQSDCPERTSLGLSSLYKRAGALQGQLSLYSSPGEGTTVHLSVPLA